MTTEILINDSNYMQFVDPDYIDGEKKSKGLIPRDLEAVPKGGLRHAKSFDLPLIPESDWQRLLDLKIKNKAQLSDHRLRGKNGESIPALDQNGKGYCWAFSSVSAITALRAANNMPYVDLSAYAVACIIKNFRDQGGFGAESIDFIAERGVPSSEFWPQKSMKRENDNPKTWENAKLHRFTHWLDLKSKSKAQLVTCLLMNIPVVSDFNWWGHSVVTLDLVSINPFRTRIWNSWGEKWSDRGMGLLEGNKALPDDMTAPYLATASEK